MMSPSRWRRLTVLPLIAAALLFSLTSQGFAKINQAGALLVPATVAPKTCSGAFRYAARVGNKDIMTVSPVQIFAEDHRMAKTRYTGRAMSGFGTDRSPLLSFNTMCG
jgi:hypothetical protein